MCTYIRLQYVTVRISRDTSNYLHKFGIPCLAYILKNKFLNSSARKACKIKKKALNSVEISR